MAYTTSEHAKQFAEEIKKIQDGLPKTGTNNENSEDLNKAINDAKIFAEFANKMVSAMQASIWSKSSQVEAAKTIIKNEFRDTSIANLNNDPYIPIILGPLTAKVAQCYAQHLRRFRDVTLGSAEKRFVDQEKDAEYYKTKADLIDTKIKECLRSLASSSENKSTSAETQPS